MVHQSTNSYLNDTISESQTNWNDTYSTKKAFNTIKHEILFETIRAIRFSDIAFYGLGPTFMCK